MDKFDKLLEEIKALHQTKKADYSKGKGYGNLDTAARIASVPTYVYCLQRAEEKLFRMKSLMEQDVKPEHESLMDSISDIISLLTIAIEVYEDQTNLASTVSHNSRGKPIN